jgi:hypothetical protein
MLMLMLCGYFEEERGAVGRSRGWLEGYVEGGKGRGGVMRFLREGKRGKGQGREYGGLDLGIFFGIWNLFSGCEMVRWRSGWGCGVDGGFLEREERGGEGVCCVSSAFSLPFNWMGMGFCGSGREGEGRGQKVR